MKNIIFTISFITLLNGAYPNAQAAPKKESRFCIDAPAILEKVESCESNKLYNQAAESCLKKISDRAAAIAKEMPKGFAKLDKNNQKLDQSHSANDYRHAIVNLEDLIATTALARVQIYDYKEHIVIPEEAEEDDTADLADSIPCFAETNLALTKIEAEMGEQQNKLEAALAAAKTNLAISNQNENNAQNLNSSTPVLSAPTQNKATQPNSSKVHLHQKSDISGTEDQKNKQKSK